MPLGIHVDTTYVGFKLESLRLGFLKGKPSLRYSILKLVRLTWSFPISLAWSCLAWVLSNLSGLGHVWLESVEILKII